MIENLVQKNHNNTNYTLLGLYINELGEGPRQNYFRILANLRIATISEPKLY